MTSKRVKNTQHSLCRLLQVFTLLVVLLLMPANLWADSVGYAILTDENEDGTKETLKFMYGEMPSGGDVWEATNTGSYYPGWHNSYPNITSIVFDSSFANARPTSCNKWFLNMSNIQSIDLRNLNTSEVTSMEYMFSNCTGLTSLNLSNFDTGKVTNMSYMFGFCSSLTSLDLSSFNTSKLKNMSEMFNGCTELTYLNLSSFDTSHVTTMGYLFKNCQALTTILANPTKWTMNSVSDVTFMFDYCNNLIGGNGTKFYSQNDYKSYAQVDQSDAPGYLTSSYPYYIAEYNSETTTLTFKGILTLPSEGQWRVENTGNTVPEWYSYRQSITSVVFEESFSGARPKSCYKWFDGCSQLTKVSANFLNTSDVEYMDYMFNGCSNLDCLEVNHARWILDNATKTSMFGGCNKLESITTLFNYYLAEWDEPTLTFKGSDVSVVNNSQWDTKNTGSINRPGWYQKYGAPDYCSSIVIDETFAKAQPVSCYQWFYEFKSLTEIIGLGYFNTSNVTNMASMFEKCTNLTLLDLSSFNTSNVTNMKDMFSSCSKLASITLGSNFSTTNVSNMENMFYNCNKLTSLDLRIFDTSRCTNMKQMFGSCIALTSLDISSFNTSNVTNMSYMFSNCNKLTSLTLTNFNTSNVTDMRGIFYNCSSLTSLDVSSFDTSNVTSMSEMFYGCSQLTSLNLTGFNTSKVTSMYRLFYDCSQLTSLNLTDFNTSIVTDMRYVFYNCSSLTSLDISGFNTENVTKMDNMFKGCSQLRTLEFGDNFDTSKVSYMSSMFSGCSSITSLDLRKFDTSKVASLSVSSMFQGCTNLQTLVLGDIFNTGNVTDISNLFSGCTALSSVDLSRFNTSIVTNMSYLFSSCSNLTSLDLSSFNTGSVTNMSYMFSSCSSLETIIISNSWNVAQVTSSSNMFNGCTMLEGGDGTKYNSSKKDKEYAVIDGGTSSPGYLTSNSYSYYIADYSIDGDDKILTFKGSAAEASGENQWSLNSGNTIPGWVNSPYTKVIFSKSFTGANPTSFYRWFYNCSSLTSIDLSSLNTSQVTNMAGMFEGCSGLTSLTLGSSFSTEGLSNESDADIADMFSGCSALETITIKGNTVPVIVKDIFASKANPSIYQLLQVNGTNTTMLDDQVDTSDGYINWKGGKFTSLNDKIKRPDISVAMTDWTYDGQTSTHTPTLSGTNASDAASVVYTYAVAGNDTYGSDVPHNVGSYTVKATVPAFVKSNVIYLAMNAVGDFSISAADLADATVDGGASLTVDYGQSTAIGALTVNYPNADYVVVYRKADVDATSIPAESIGLYSVVLKPSDTGNLTGEKVTGYTVNVQLPVVFKQCEWVTYYDERFNLATPAGYQAYKVTGASSSGVTAEAIDYIPMGVPVILHTNQSGTSSESMTIRLNEQTSTSEISRDAAFVGIPSTETSGVTPSGTAYILVGDQFVLYEGSAAIPAHRCYLSLTSEARKRSLGIDFGDGTTSLRELEGSEEWKEKREMWYTLDGRKLNTMPQKKGLYVRNGQKVVVK